MRKSPLWRRLQLISSRRPAYRLCEQCSFPTSSPCFESLKQCFQTAPRLNALRRNTLHHLKTLRRTPLMLSLLSWSFFCLSTLGLSSCTQDSCEKTLTCPESGGGSGQSDEDSDSDGSDSEGGIFNSESTLTKAQSAAGPSSRPTVNRGSWFRTLLPSARTAPSGRVRFSQLTWSL